MPAATKAEYERLLADRPRKFTGAEAGYVPAAKNDGDYTCSDCLHFYTGKAAGRSVCEVVRLTPERSIEPKARCKFWTHAGLKFPLLRSDG
jgi:hypothetical protein